MYVGQFANGFEHGTGTKTYRDGSIFEGANILMTAITDVGRFRFGRRDGPGVLRLANGQVQKGNFRDQLAVNEKSPPPVFDGYVDKNDPQHPVYNPDSLLTSNRLCLCVIIEDVIAYSLLRSIVSGNAYAQGFVPCR